MSNEKTPHKKMATKTFHGIVFYDDFHNHRIIVWQDGSMDAQAKNCTVIIHDGPPERVYTESEVRAMLDDLRDAAGHDAIDSTMTRNGIAAVLLDPPYSLTGAVYAHDSSTVSGDVRAWCIENGQNPKLRIALCGHDTEHNDLEAMGWTVETWAKSGGYQGADDRERIWFSPACLGAELDGDQIDLFAPARSA